MQLFGLRANLERARDALIAAAEDIRDVVLDRFDRVATR